MQTNRALACATKLVGALDNPRSIVSLQSSDNAATTSGTSKYLHEDFVPLESSISNFDLVYRLMAKPADNTIWLYVYERKVVVATQDFGTAYNLSSNPSVMEVVSAQVNCNDEFSAFAANARNVVGVPIRVRLRLSKKLMTGQRYLISAATGEPDAANPYSGQNLPADVNTYALAYLPLVAEFYAHDFSTDFKTRVEVPLLVQNIIVSR